MKHSHIFIRVFVSIGISASLLIFSCETGESVNAVKVSVKEVPKRADTDIRDSYVIFRISAEESVTDYHLAVKESSKGAPTAAENDFRCAKAKPRHRTHQCAHCPAFECSDGGFCREVFCG